MSGALGACGGCGGELPDGSLRLSLTAGPGPRPGGFTSSNGTELERFEVCPACLAGEAAAGTLLIKMLQDPYARHIWRRKPKDKCEIACKRPRHTSRVLIGRRTEYDDAYCPVCFGPAEVTAAQGASPVKIGLRDRLRRRIPMREPWNVTETPETPQ